MGLVKPITKIRMKDTLRFTDKGLIEKQSQSRFIDDNHYAHYYHVVYIV